MKDYEAYKLRFVGINEVKIKKELEDIAKKEMRSLKGQIIYIFKKYLKEKKDV